MFARVILCLVFVSIVCSCKNEPYDEKPLGIIGLLNHATGINYSFRYRNQKIYTFHSVRGADTLVRKKFYYSGDQLTSITSDSTKTSWTVTTIHNTRSNIAVDSTFTFSNGTRTLSFIRTITYGESGYPDAVKIVAWFGGVGYEERAELTWEGDNVVRLITYTNSTATNVDVLVNDMTIGYDNKSCVYMRNPVYLFTLNPRDYFWLSANNPILFSDSKGVRKYTYWYNRMGYPSNFKTETDVLFGASYTQVR